MRKIAIRCALIVFGITTVWTLLEHVLGYNTTNHKIGQYTRMVTVLIYYGFVAFAIWLVRKQQNNTLLFADGIKTGSLTSLVYSALVTCWFALYAEVINTQYQPSLMAFERGKLETAGATPDQITEKLKEVEMSSGGSVVSYVLLFTFMFLFGLIVSIIASLLLKRKKSNMI